MADSAKGIARLYVTILVVLLLAYLLITCWEHVNDQRAERVRVTLLLPFALCMSQVAIDAANQSLAEFTDAPMAITAMQATGTAAVLLLTPWLQYTGDLSILVIRWVPACAGFVFFQIVNHLVSERCSLIERAVVQSFSPFVTYAVERTCMPPGVPSRRLPLETKAWMVAMSCGACVFVSGGGDVTVGNTCTVLLLVVVAIPFRLLQRIYVAQYTEAPIALLAGMDGLALALPSAAVSTLALEDFKSTVRSWFYDSAFVVVLSASVVAFVAHHLLALALLRVGTASNFWIFANLGTFLNVAMGIMVFHESVQNSLQLTGLSISLGSGLMYAVSIFVSDEAENTRPPVKPVGT